MTYAYKIFQFIIMFCFSLNAAEFKTNEDILIYELKQKEFENKNLKKMLNNQAIQYRYQVKYLNEKIADESYLQKLYELEQTQSSTLRAMTEKFLIAKAKQKEAEDNLALKDKKLKLLLKTNRELASDLADIENQYGNIFKSLGKANERSLELESEKAEYSRYASNSIKEYEIKIVEMEGEIANLENTIMELKSNQGSKSIRQPASSAAPVQKTK